MKVLLDLNVLLDVFQQRQPHFQDSAEILNRVVNGELQGAIAGHAVTTLYYLVNSLSDKEEAIRAVDFLLVELEIVPEDRQIFLRARDLEIGDYEDAVIASAAEAAGCEAIVSRNVKDFRASPVPAVTPREMLADED